MMKNKRIFFTILGISLVFFLGLYIVFGVGIYNDSIQYMEMHIHREPVYPLFLWLFRVIIGENVGSQFSILGNFIALEETSEFTVLVYHHVVAIVQSIFAAIATTYFVCYIRDTFSIGKISTAMIFLASIAPHVLTPMFSVETVILTSGMMSEALCLPLFLIYLVACHKMLLGNKKSIFSSLLIGLMLSLIRGQMMVTFLIWMVLLAGKVIASKQWKKILWIAAFTALAFLARSYTVKTYNLIFNDYFIGTTYGSVNTFANILYVTEREDGELIEDLELRELFYEMHDVMDENQLSSQYATGTRAERTAHLENSHDEVKFRAVESTLRNYSRTLGIEEYIPQDIEGDIKASALTKALLLDNLFPWVVNYLCLAWNGVVRTIAIVHPIMHVYVAFMLLGSLGLMGYYFYKDGGESKCGWMLAIAVLSICAISFSTALTIMCLSRYMVYGFSGFYVAVYLGGIEFIKRTRRVLG